jgi:hypothetical protein
VPETIQDQILDLQQAFDRAELRADAATLGELIADDFTSIGPKGFRWQLAAIQFSPLDDAAG